MAIPTYSVGKSEALHFDAPYSNSIVPLPATTWRLFCPYLNLIHVAPLKLLAAVYLAVIVACVGFRLAYFYPIVLGRPECSVEILIGFASRCDF